MSEKFQNKYRISSARLQTWDYGWDAAYFVTICTKNRKCFFGEIDNNIMELSRIGVIADILWNEIKNHAINVTLGEYVIMPNHVHGIIILDGNAVAVETGHALSLSQPQPPTPGQKRMGNQGKNTLSSIIGGYKSAVTKHAHRLKFEFEWQTRFHDHIIRDGQSFQNISQYIINNPKKWAADRFNKL